MPGLRTYTLEEISRRLEKQELPISGITKLGSCEFHINEPVHYAGLVLHSGHRVRPDILEILSVGEQDRFREEDPYMDRFIKDFPIQLIARDSRFEYDLNWEIEKAIYSAGSKKWGLNVWKRELNQKERSLSLAKFGEFHYLLDLITEFLLKQGRQALIFDMHSFCYQREAKQLWYKDEMPEINLGTKALRRDHFAPLLDKLMAELSHTEVNGQRMRVAENVLFPGGYVSRKYSRLYPEQVLVLALEFKKIFMDEWTGEIFRDPLGSLIASFMNAAKAIIPFDAEY